MDALPDGRIVASVWSRVESIPYECAVDKVTLMRLSSGGLNAETLSSETRRVVWTSSCRNALTMLVLPVQQLFYPPGWAILSGSATSFDAYSSGEELAASAHGGRSGDFSFGTFSIASASEHFAHVAGEWNRFGVVRSNPAQVGSLSFADLPSVPLPLGEIAGIAGAIVPVTIAGDATGDAWYVGFANDGGQVGVAKYRLDGPIDTGWGGGDGVVPIVGSGQRGQPPASHGLATDVRLVSLRPGGNVVVVTADGIIERLIGDSAVARGGFVLTITAYLDQGEAITEANRAWRFTVQRTGGSTGPVSVEYRVVGEEVHGARAGEDFVATTGRLDWSDGDVEPRSFDVRTLDDQLVEGDEDFYVELHSPTGSAGVLVGQVTMTIFRSDEPPAPGSSVNSGGGGGGGSMGLFGLLAMLVGGVQRRLKGCSEHLGGRVMGPLTAASCMVLASCSAQPTASAGITARTALAADVANTSAAGGGEFEAPSGFTKEQRGTATVYCRDIVHVGTRFPTKHCFTQADIERIERRAKSVREDFTARSGMCTARVNCGDPNAMIKPAGR